MRRRSKILKHRDDNILLFPHGAGQQPHRTHSDQVPFSGHLWVGEPGR